MSSNSIFPISKQSIIVNQSSRLIIKLPVNTFDSGITGGDVIRFDTVGNKYKKSLADTSSNAEVFGIVENINSDGSANVVINGSINYPESKLVDKAVVGEEINLGGNDVYFLSGYTAGLLENRITDDKIVIKPLLQKAPHGAYNGIFRNYLGYKQGNINSSVIEDQFFVSFSDDLTKLITVSVNLDKVFVYSISYSSLVFTTTLLDTIEFNTLSGDSIEWDTETTEAKISNNGYDILIFTKQNNKIFHINRQIGIQLKAQIDADLTGNAVDKLWAVDDELSSIALSTVAMNRDPDPDDMKLTSRDVTSRIKYLRRKPDGKNKFNWSIINEHTVPGFLLANPFPALPKQDSLGLVLGVFRANNIKCKGKNYILTTKCLIQDQKEYKSAANGPRSSKYNNSQFDYMDLYSKTITYKFGSDIDASNNPIYDSFTIKDHNMFIDGHLVYTSPSDLWYSESNIDAPNLTQRILTAFQDNVNNKKYKCYFGIKNFKIVNKKNNKYLDDPSCLGSNSFAYYHPIEYREGHYRNDFENFYPSGITFLTKLTPQTRSLSRINASQYNQNALFSSGSCSDTFFVIGLLYESIDTTNNDINKKFVVLKFPLNSYENDSVFDYFQYSTTYNSVIPSLSGYGIISSFYTDAFSEITNFWTAPSTTTKGPITDNPTFPVDTQLTSVNINQLNSFELHTSNDRYFLCTSTYTLIWTYSSGTYVIKDIADLDQYKFSYSADGEFFIKNNKILRYDSGTQEFINITVV